jgi:diguanylate cyclase (GGDEF)-like protein
MNQKLNPINLKKYLPFFQESIECPCALGLFSHDGCLKLIAQEGNQEDFELLAKHFENCGMPINATSHGNHDIIGFGSDGAIAKIALMLPDCEQSPWLAGLLKLPAHEINSAQRVKAIKTLTNIADCIVDDYTIQQTLTDIVGELTVRYEELNLLYGLDDADTFQNPVDEVQALNHLLKNCSVYMNVNLAVLYLPELDLSLQIENTAYAGFDLSSALITIQNSLYRHIAAERKTLVVNRQRDIDWPEASPNSANKMIAVPIMLTKQHLVGILVIVNSPHKPDFSNSDRKLCDVMASEAAKLIQARRDSITGLINRRGFTEKLHQALTKTKTSQITYSLLFLDIDQFKIINDTSGQKAGDQLLNQIGSLITSAVGHKHIVGRLGADEFGVLMQNFDLEKAGQIAEKIRQQINQFRFAYENKLYDISVCIGVAELQADFDDISIPLSAADLACNVAKEQGRNRVHIYHPSDYEMIRHENEMHWVSRINLALEQERFQIYRQKILPLNSRPDAKDEEHYEILLRLKDESGNLIPPLNFIPAAERYNLMSKLDRWVVTNALSKMAAALRRDTTSKLSCSINLSGQSFCEPGFVEFVIGQINLSGVPSNRICFEITETAAVSNLSQTVKFMEALKDIGCSFSLDDFGSGMSSFTYLKNLPVDYLKIDGYFVKNMLNDPIDLAMVKSIHEIGQVMGLKTIAEFVENDQILEQLVRLGVDYGQGYGIGKPEPFE